MGALVHDDMEYIQRLRQKIYDEASDVAHAGASILIGKLPGGPLRYLHKLFAPSEDAPYELGKILGFSPSDSYAAFFLMSNGATLFDNTLFLYGMGDAGTREVSVDNIKPVSLNEQVAISRMANPGLEWIEVGSIAAATENYSIQVNSHGLTALSSSSGQRREYTNFLAALLVFVEVVQSSCGLQGITDESAAELQIEIENLIGRRH